MILYFMRHGESLANEKSILASRKDFSLSVRGKEDVKEIAREFAEKIGKPDGIISSPLARAQETARPFCSLFNIDLEIDGTITEQELGIYSGMTYEEVESAPGYEKDRTKRWDWIPEGGESYSMIARRLKPFFDRMEKRAEQEDSGSLLIVTHAVTLRLIRAHLEKTLPQYPREIAKNGEIWEVDFTTAQQACIIKSHLLGESAHREGRA